VKVPEARSVKPYSLRIAVFVGSAASASALVWSAPCKFHPAKLEGRIAADPVSLGVGVAAKTNVARRQIRKTGISRRKIMGEKRKGPSAVY
jgi:hypothetical protein